MKIKIKDLTYELIEKIDKYDCEENCCDCSFNEEKSYLGKIGYGCVCNFIKTLVIQQDLQNIEIDVSSLSPKKYSSVIEMCEDMELDKEFVLGLKESIEHKEVVRESLKNIYKYLQDSKADENVLKDFYNVWEYLENN